MPSGLYKPRYFKVPSLGLFSYGGSEYQTRMQFLKSIQSNWTIADEDTYNKGQAPFELCIVQVILPFNFLTPNLSGNIC